MAKITDTALKKLWNVRDSFLDTIGSVIGREALERNYNNHKMLMYGTTLAVGYYLNMNHVPAESLPIVANVGAVAMMYSMAAISNHVANKVSRKVHDVKDAYFLKRNRPTVVKDFVNSHFQFKSHEIYILEQYLNKRFYSLAEVMKREKRDNKIFKGDSIDDLRYVSEMMFLTDSKAFDRIYRKDKSLLHDVLGHRARWTNKHADFPEDEMIETLVKSKHYDNPLDLSKIMEPRRTEKTKGMEI